MQTFHPRKPCFEQVMVSYYPFSISCRVPYLLQSAPRRLLNFSRLKCGAYSRAALIWGRRLFKICTPQKILSFAVIVKSVFWLSVFLSCWVKSGASCPGKVCSVQNIYRTLYCKNDKLKKTNKRAVKQSLWTAKYRYWWKEMFKIVLELLCSAIFSSTKFIK